jgi:DNA-binding response OmpR family regulator
LILYIEQHEDSRDMLALLLELHGHKVATAKTPAEALNIIRKQWFDLYILESRFPDISGVELCQQIRALHPKVPIVFYSSAVFRKDIEAGLGAGAQRYLTKPEGINMIKEVVADLLLDTR